MCIIVDNSAGVKIDEEIIDDCFRINQHGSALYLIDEDVLHKSLDNKKMKALVKEANKEKKKWVLHCRYMTQGKVCIENVHMFEEGDYLIAMNGTVSGLADKDTNDTKQVIEMMKLVKPNKVKKFLQFYEARFLIINRKTKKIIKTGKWIEDDGAFYSKDNVLNYYYYGGTGYSYSSSYNWSSKSSNKTSTSTNDRDWGVVDKQVTAKDDTYYPEEWVSQNGVMIPASSATGKEDNRVFGFQAAPSKGDTMLIGTYGLLSELFDNPTSEGTFVENVLSKDKFVLDEFEGTSYIQRGKYEDSDHQQLTVWEMSHETVDWLDHQFKAHPEYTGSVDHIIEKELVRVVGDSQEYNVWVYFLSEAVVGGVK